MRRFLITILYFTGLATVFYMLLVCIVGDFGSKALKKNLLYRRSYMLNEKRRDIPNHKQVDILFLGSSHVYRGFDPRIFAKQGISIFNLGTSSQTLVNSEVLLKRHIEELNPKLVIIEVNQMMLTADGVESSLQIVSNFRNDLESIKMAIRVNNPKVYNTLAYSFYKHLVEPTDKRYTKRKNEKYIKGGYVQRAIKHNASLDMIDEEWISRTMQSYSSLQLASLGRICNFLRDKKIHFLLIQVPVTSYRYELYARKKAFDKDMASYGEYYNFNALISLNDTLHFSDSHHLNQKGVNKFNRFFIKKLKLGQ